MAFHVHNTMTRALEKMVPLEGNHIRLYTCGPTVYDFAHIGNFRAYMFEDLLKRYLVYSGFEMTHVMNLTDVDDKTIRGANAQGLALNDYTSKYIDAFYSDLDLLQIQRADHYPAATDHIGDMIAMIETLIEKGYAYPSDDGSVYFSISKFDGYGKLAHLDLSGMKAGARVSQDEYDKDTAADFALWKAHSEADGEICWDSPWGKGRPGWHIECSAMSMRYLGESFDIHCGGIDNMFPHHEDEIAQSEAATGKEFVKYWMHCAHLIVDGQKMSKSLGNFHTLGDILEKGYSGREIRYVLIGTHYRQTLNFSFEGLDGARAALSRTDEFTSRLKEVAGDRFGSLPAFAEKTEVDFKKAMDDDLNISGARAAVFDLVHAGNKALDEKALSSEEAAAILELLKRVDTVFGYLEAPESAVPDEVLKLVDERQQARADKNWAESDRIRDLLKETGYEIKDTPEGAKIKKA